MNEKYSAGYQSVEIEVLAFEEGSFNIPVRIKKKAKALLFTVAGGVLGNLATDLLKNVAGTNEIHTSDNVVIVDNSVLLKNKSTADSVGAIAGLATSNDNIRDISLTYDKQDGNREKVTISKEILKEVAQKSVEEEQFFNIQTNLTLVIVSPVFSDEPASWKVCYNGGTPFMARMMDLDFIENIGAKKIAFGKGDAIVADLETTITYTDKGPQTKHNIVKVHSFPRYTKISRHKDKEGDLFGD